MGDNSTISCCEVLNALIFPYHEQHHNNSFLIAAMIQGQSNMAAAATVGSNHNTRGNDGEIIAGRGFWPGLSTTLKHNCRFASFVLLNKGNYPAELDIPFPFSLVSDNLRNDCLDIMPAYFWMYNMYALARNNDKFKKRDKRKTKTQKIETEVLACDTAGEIMHAMALLEYIFEAAWTAAGNPLENAQQLLAHKREALKVLPLFAENIEHSARPVKILHGVDAWYAYRDMLVWYGVTVLAKYMDETSAGSAVWGRFNIQNGMIPWINAGGQLIREDEYEQLRTGIEAGALNTWQEIHAEYERLWKRYPFDRAEHAYSVLCRLAGVPALTKSLWQSYLDEALRLNRYIEEQILITKKKDYTNHFRDITYRNRAERDAVLGHVEDNAFVQQSKQDTQQYAELFARVGERL